MKGGEIYTTLFLYKKIKDMALNCPALTEVVADCENSFGGLDIVGLIDREKIASTTLGTDDEITALTFDDPLVDYFKKMVNTRDVATFSDNGTADTAVGSTMWEHNLVLQFKRRDIAKRNSVKLMAAGQRDIAALFRDGNGQWWLAGYHPEQDRGLQLASTEQGTGAAPAEKNGYTVTLTQQMREQAYPVDSAIALGLLVDPV